MNVYSFNDTLVSIIKAASPLSKVMTSKGEIFEVPNNSLVKAKLVTGGVYNENFMQMALGGLIDSPVVVNPRMNVLHGKVAMAVVEPIGQGLVRMAIGVPAEAAGPGEQAVRDLKINKNKKKDLNKDAIGEMDELDSMGDEPEALKIDSDEPIGHAERVVLEWGEGMEDVSISDMITALENAGIPSPTVVKIDTGKEVITKKKSQLKKKMVKKAGYGPAPIMTHVCPKCQTMLLLEVNRKTGATVMKCPNKDYEALYEGSLPGQGVAGQTDPE